MLSGFPFLIDVTLQMYRIILLFGIHTVIENPKY